MEIMAENVDGMGLGVPGNIPNKEKPELPQAIQNLVKYCMKLYDEWAKSDYRKRKIDEAKESRRIYEQIENEKTKNWPWKNASNIVLPLATITIDNLEPRLVAGLIGKEPIVRFDMTGKEEKSPEIELVEDWYNKELVNTIGIEDYTMSVGHSLLLDGTIYPVPKYDLNEKNILDFVYDEKGQRQIDPQTGKPATIEQVEVEYEGGDIDLVPMTDMFHADDIGTIKEWEKADKARMVRLTYSELMGYFQKKTKGYVNIGPWLLAEKADLIKTEDDKTPGQSVAGVEVTGKENIECLEFHISYPIFKNEDDDENEQVDFREERLVVTIAKDSEMPVRIIKNMDLNMRNESAIKRIRLFPEAGRSLGTCVYGKLKGVQNGSSDLFNLIVNAAYIGMMPWYFYDEKAGIKGKQEIFPGAGVACDNKDGILFANFNSNPEAHLAVLNFLVTLWQRLESIGDYQIGTQGQEKRTATEVMAVIQEGNIKHNYQAKTTKAEFITVLKCLYDLYYKNMPFNKTFTFNGQEVPIPRQAMRRNVRFALTGSTEMANKLIERKSAENLYTQTAQNPLVDPSKTTTDLLKAYGKENPAEYIRPEVRQLLQMFMQNPEILQVVGSYLKTKAETAKAVTGQGGGAQIGATA